MNYVIRHSSNRTLHGVRGLKQVKANGCYTSYANDADKQNDNIFNNKNGNSRMVTTAHEIGHFLDRRGISSITPFASHENKEILAMLEEARNANSYKSLMKEYAGYNEAIRYLDCNEEVFARAYAQWIATKSKNIKMLSEIRIRGDQWSEEDFLPVVEKMDALMKELRWLKI